MKWKKFRIKTVTEAEDIIISTLYDLGLEGAQIEDSVPLTAWEKEQMFVDIMPDAPADDGIAYLNFFVEEDEEGRLIMNGEVKQEEKILEEVKEELESLRMFCDIGEGSVSVDETEDIDWINNWKQYFHPIPVGEKLLIRPTWEEAYDPQGRTVLHLEPGLAFGTGTHETTRLCLELLEKYLKPGMSLLDVGCGSGILSVAGLLLGAEKAVGVDIDALAVKTAGENAQTNGVEEKFQGICGNLTDQVAGKYELVVANIVADIIILLTKDITRYLNPDSIYLMSGIIDTRVQEVRDALEPRFTILEERQEKGWFALAAKQKS